MTKRLTTALLAVLIVGAVPGVAVAQEDPANRADTEATRVTTRPETETHWIETVKGRALEAIEKRLVTLTDLEDAIESSETVQANHAAQLMQDVRFSVKGLEDLAGEIRAATDLETLRALVPRIFEDYRVYAVVVPKAHLTLAADAAGAVADRLGELADSIEVILDRLEEAGFDVEPAGELLAGMVRLVESGAAGAESVPGILLDLEPADYPGSTGVLRTAHEALQTARSDLRAGGETAREIGEYVRSLFEGGDD